MNNPELEKLRSEIDSIDQRIFALLGERLATADRIADVKRKASLPVYDPARERAKLHALLESAPDGLREDYRALCELFFELSRTRQTRFLQGDSPLSGTIRDALARTPDLFPADPSVACQGTEGAYSQIAADRLFRHPNILYFNNFASVFAAVEKGLCRYGVVPLENSTAGSVNGVYDLLTRHHFTISRSTRLKIDHSLLAQPGADLSKIREIHSHEQAFAQCADFLQTLPQAKLIPAANTAAAAQDVAAARDPAIAAIASPACAKLYGLERLRDSIQSRGNNRTRFVCISRDLEIFPGADRTSLMATLPHRPGSLYRLLARFNALDINLVKLESRPLPDRDFEFMFYFDLEIPASDPRFLQLIETLPDVCESLVYLGSYSEVS